MFTQLRDIIAWHDIKHPNDVNVPLQIFTLLLKSSNMDDHDAEALKLQEYWKQVMEEYTSDSSKLHEYLKQNMVDFPAGDRELQIFKFRYGRNCLF